ncbi:hypothetical protein ACFX2C_014840 [Malus domestica]
MEDLKSAVSFVKGVTGFHEFAEFTVEDVGTNAKSQMAACFSELVHCFFQDDESSAAGFPNNESDSDQVDLASLEHLTSLHPEFLLLCLLSKSFKAGYSILDDDIFEVDQLRDLFLYCYYGWKRCEVGFVQGNV